MEIIFVKSVNGKVAKPKSESWRALGIENIILRNAEYKKCEWCEQLSVELPRAVERSENDGMSEVSAGLYEVCAERLLSGDASVPIALFPRCLKNPRRGAPNGHSLFPRRTLRALRAAMSGECLKFPRACGPNGHSLFPRCLKNPRRGAPNGQPRRN